MDTPESQLSRAIGPTTHTADGQEPSMRELKQRAGSRREGAVKQESLASLTNSRNEVRRSVGSQGQATSRAPRNDARKTRGGRGGNREGAEAATRGFQGCPAGHRQLGQAVPQQGRRGPAGLRHLERLHRPGRRDAARRDAGRRNAASGVQPGLPEGTRNARRTGRSTRPDAAVRPAVEKLPATENAQVQATSRQPGTQLATWIQSERSKTKAVEQPSAPLDAQRSTKPNPTAGPGQRKRTTRGASASAGRGSNQRHE